MAEGERRRGPGRVLLVGAGPGDPDLITLRGVEALRRADVVVYDSLAPAALLEWAPPEAERIDVGKRGHDAPTRDQADINALLVARARAGAVVVRLKGGDPFVYGRGGEELSACRAAGVPVEVVPGVSSAIAAAGAAGIPLTDRRYGASVAIVTGHRDRERPWTSVDWERLAVGADTVVVLMGMRNLEKIVDGLLAHGRSPDTPAAVVMEGATVRQQVVVAPLSELAVATRRAGLRAPALVVVGEVVRLRDEFLEASPKRPLAGRRLVLTRPLAAGDAVARALRDAGAEVTALPLIEIEPFAPDPALDATLGSAERYGTWFFTSGHAVELCAQHLERLGIRPATLEAPLHCVGSATAESARRAGFRDVRVPDGVRDGETLARAWLATRSPSDAPAIFPRARDASGALAERLRDAGVALEEVVLYATHPLQPSRRAIDAARRADAILFASPSAVRAFFQSLDGGPLPLLSAIGPTTTAALREAGAAAVVTSERPEGDAWVEALERAFAEVVGADAVDDPEEDEG